MNQRRTGTNPQQFRSCCLTAAILLIIGCSVPGRGAQISAADVPRDLASLFTSQFLLQDQNGDGVIDSANVNFVLATPASAEEIAAASELAARLGFETGALNLPFGASGSESTIPLVIGMSAARNAGLNLADLHMDDMEDGSGLIQVITLASGPALVVAGHDGAGTRAAAIFLAGRFPHVWDPKGMTIGAAVEKIRDFLVLRKVSLPSIHVPALRLVDRQPGLERLYLEVRVRSASDALLARDALQELIDPADGQESLIVPGTRLLSVLIRDSGDTRFVVDIPGETPKAKEGPVSGRPGAGAKERMDLSNLYMTGGFLGDSDSNLIPDRSDVILVPSADSGRGAIDIAARIGLESTGISIPLALPADQVEKPEAQPTMVLIGLEHKLINQLREDQKLHPDPLEPGEGLIQIVPKAFGKKPALVITGGDPEGLARAVSQVAERFPHIWQRGKDRPTVGEVTEELHRFLSARSPAGQAAAALYKLRRIAAELEGKELEAAHVYIHVDRAPEGFEEFVRREAESLIRTNRIEVTVGGLHVHEAEPILSEELEVPSEVERFWDLFRTRILPAVQRGQPAVIEALLSEPPEVRRRIEVKARAELLQAGAAEGRTEVKVLSAYKQGFSWLQEAVLPQLAGKPLSRIAIRFAEIGPPEEWKHQAMYAPTRWLLELFPIDEVLARDLQLDLDQITFEKAPIGSPTYEVIARDSSGQEILRRSFEPRLVVRPYFDQFPGYEKVRVTTGWLSAQVADEQVIDERIITDPEHFWDHFQAKTLPALYEHVMSVHEGKPQAADAPFFGELRVDVSLSEPDFRLGIDEEQISSMEALHEDVYFGTLHFLDVLGRFTRGQPLRYPGRVIPIMRPLATGRSGSAKISLTGFGASRPGVTVEYREQSGLEGKTHMGIAKVSLLKPVPLTARVKAGSTGIGLLEYRVKADTEKDLRADWIQRTRAERVDSQIISAEQIDSVLSILESLRDEGLFSSSLSYQDLGILRVYAGWEHEIDLRREANTLLAANGRPDAFPDIRRYMPEDGDVEQPLVQWDTPIPPDESNKILAMMSTFAEATVYKAGSTYLGRDVWAMDLMSPVEATHWSQAKATTLKPTLIYSARQHANEVSATSHVLKLAELLLTEPEYKEKLKKVNVVIHPITNPDGAQLAYDLYRITPYFMLHAGYLGSLGVDVTSSQWESDPVYPEAKVRPKLWTTWLPDIFLNPHGYPSHEWVQLFSEYAGWVRSRVTESRGWWGMRGWFMPGFSYLDDPKYPRHKEAAFEIRERITRAINAVPELRALNERAYARYRRYGFDHDKKNFKLDFSDDVLIYTAIKGSRASSGNSNFMRRQPKITIWSGTTEAPDETAQGDWLKLVANAGLQWDRALLDYLVDGEHTIERKTDTFYKGVRISMNRPRPPKPKKDEKSTEAKR